MSIAPEGVDLAVKISEKAAEKIKYFAQTQGKQPQQGRCHRGGYSRATAEEQVGDDGDEGRYYEGCAHSKAI